MSTETTFFDSQPYATMCFMLYMVPLLLLWFAVIKTGKKKFSYFLVCISLVYIFVLYYWTYGKYFFGIKKIDSSGYELIYLYPTRNETVFKSDIERIYIEYGYKGTYIVNIRKKDGRVYAGAPTNKYDASYKLAFLND